jgi:hypothetical protein
MLECENGSPPKQSEEKRQKTPPCKNPEGRQGSGGFA